MEWFVEISGDEGCLEKLIEIFNNSDPKISKNENGMYLLYSSRFEGVKEDREINTIAANILSRINIILSLKTECKKGIKVNSIGCLDDNHKEKCFVYFAKGISMSTSSGVGVISGGKEIDLEAKTMNKYWHLVNSNDENLIHVFNLFFHDNKTYPGIYKILDGIFEDLGSKEVYAKLASKTQIKRLKGSVNNLATVGIEHARHGKKGVQQKDPMYLPEARALINSIFWKWVELKSQSLTINQ